MTVLPLVVRLCGRSADGGQPPGVFWRGAAGHDHRPGRRAPTIPGSGCVPRCRAVRAHLGVSAGLAIPARAFARLRFCFSGTRGPRGRVRAWRARRVPGHADLPANRGDAGHAGIRRDVNGPASPGSPHCRISRVRPASPGTPHCRTSPGNGARPGSASSRAAGRGCPQQRRADGAVRVPRPLRGLRDDRFAGRLRTDGGRRARHLRRPGRAAADMAALAGRSGRPPSGLFPRGGRLRAPRRAEGAVAALGTPWPSTRPAGRPAPARIARRAPGGRPCPGPDVPWTRGAAGVPFPRLRGFPARCGARSGAGVGAGAGAGAIAVIFGVPVSPGVAAHAARTCKQAVGAPDEAALAR